MRAKVIEVFYDGAAEPSVSVPAVDFFGVPWGRPVHLTTALTAINEGRGSTATCRCRSGGRCGSSSSTPPTAPPTSTSRSTTRSSRTWRRRATCTRCSGGRTRRGCAATSSSPTAERPGRFVGCVVGVRVLDGGQWYGEGEVKVYLDGDTDLPTICGTGLEDYVGTAGHGRAPDAVRGAPLEVRDPEGGPNPDFVGFYRWHVPDPIMFARDLRVTIQQIGYEVFRAGDEDRMAAKEPAGDGRHRLPPWRRDRHGTASGSTTTAVSPTSCVPTQPVPRLDVAAEAGRHRPPALRDG